MGGNTEKKKVWEKKINIAQSRRSRKGIFCYHSLLSLQQQQQQ